MTDRRIEVLLTIDGRRLQLGLMQAERRTTRARLRRLRLRFKIWRLNRDLERHP